MPSYYFHRTSKINNDSYITIYRAINATKYLTCRQVLSLLQRSQPFREVFIKSLNDLPFKGFFFEGRPITNDPKVLDEPYFWIGHQTEFPTRRQADLKTYAPYFDTSLDRPPIVTFKNLSGDTTLISPNANYHSLHENQAKKFGHLKQFLQYAPEEMIHSYLKTISKEIQRNLKENPDKICWHITHGHGVFYLHFRIQNNRRYLITPELHQLASAKTLYSQHWT